MGHIFISYSHKDKEYVHKLHEALLNEGFGVWIDDRIDYGDKWLKAIEKNLDDCDAFIIVMSKNSSESEMVLNEITRARDLEKQIFPLLLDGKNWLVVQARQFVDVRDGSLPTEKFYKRLETVAPRDNGKREFAEKVAREGAEHEAAKKNVRKKAEKAAREKLEYEATEKAKREKATRQAARKAALKETLTKSFTILKSAFSKAFPFLRIVGFTGIVIALLWGGSLAVPKFISLIPTAKATATSSPIVEVTSATSTVVPTKTRVLTVTRTPTNFSTSTPDYLIGNEIVFATKDGTLYSFLNNSYSKIGTISLSEWVNADGMILGDYVWSWNANKDFFLYQGLSSDTDAYLVDRTGTVRSSLKVPYFNYCPNISPDGEKIAVSSQATNKANIWIFNIDGTGFSRLTPESSTSYGYHCPAWSPSGTMIAAGFGRKGYGSSGVAILGLDGRVINQFDIPSDWWDSPKWSPDSKSLIYCSQGSDVNLLNIENGTIAKLLLSDAIDCDWSPDGKYLVYSNYFGLNIFDINEHTNNDLLIMEDIVAVAWK